MPIQIKPLEKVLAKYKQNASAAGGSYTDGVNFPKRDQAEAAIAAKDAFAQGVQEAIAQDRFAKGVAAAGSAKWKEKATGVGAQRFAPGITAGANDFAKGVAPYLDALRNVTLPVRMPKGNEANLERVRTVNTALRATKLSRS